MSARISQPVGTFSLVLHSHLPWLAHAGHWPVGEEWLHQAWAGAYGPVLDVLDRMADEGRTNLLNLGVTPVLHAMLDDPYSLSSHHDWLGWWLVRAQGAVSDGVSVGAYEGQLARAALERFDTRLVHGVSPWLRDLSDRGAVEILGGPAAHPFQPRQDAALTAFQLEVGLADHQLRLGSRPTGMWAPECAYAPGLERAYADAGVGHFVVDGPTVHGRTAAAYDVAGSGVVAFPRDLEVTYRVWSPRAGYPGSGAYRDFHTFDHPSGLRPSRVTSKGTAPEQKKAYDPQLAAAQASADASDFVSRVRNRLVDAADREGRPGLVVAAYDTELFGHWWHEGPQWLEQVLRQLPEAGVRVTTLSGALDHVSVEPAELTAGSWGRGKDFRVWDSPVVADIAALDAEVGEQLLRMTKKHSDFARSEPLDQLARETILATQSDWAFMVTGNSAADYARSRVHHHAERAGRLASAIERGDQARAESLASTYRETAGPFGHLDSRLLAAWSDS